MDELATLILDTQQRLLADWRAGWTHVATPRESARLWATMGETGLLGALGTKESGGLGHDADFTFEFMAGWGRGAGPGTAIPTLVGGHALLPDTVMAGLVPGLADGSIRLAMPASGAAPGGFPAPPAQTGRTAPAGGAAQAGRAAGDVAFLGDAGILRDAGFATHAVLPARVGADPAVLCLEIGQLALSAPFTLVDGSTAATLAMTEIAVADSSIVWRGAAARTAWESAMARMAAAAAGEAAGLLRSMLEQTAVYVRQRKQFGQAIGSFQTVQHRMADMLVDVEQTHSLALAAIRDPGNAMLVSAAKARANRSLRFVANQSVQLHGGVGTTQELPLSRYYRRALVLAGEFGTTPEHLDRVEAGLAARIHSSRAAV